MNTTSIIGIFLMLPFAYGALFQGRPKNWAFEHACVAVLEIAGFAIGLILILIGVFM